MAMIRLLVGVTSLSAVIFLCGCPIYSDSSPGSVAVLCSGTLQDCPTESCTDSCIPWQCTWDSDCPNSGYSCVSAVCTVSGVDAALDCTTTGCGAGYVCKLANGTASCVELLVGGSEAGAVSPDAAADAGSLVDAARTDSRIDTGVANDADAVDASIDGGPAVDANAVDITAEDATEQDGPDSTSEVDGSATSESSAGDDAERGAEAGGAASCNADTDCVSSSDRCVDGQCVSPASLCSDGTQCVVSGDRCVDGICELPCSGSTPTGCPVGFACDTELGACSINPAPCAGSGSSTCPSGSVCVEQRCVAQCLPSEAGASCALPGQVCVNGGCIPDEAALFTCKNDGQTSQLANVCLNGSVCLHHDCYVECDGTADAGSPCADPSKTCREVTVAAGTYGVCAPPGGLGSDCDIAAMAPCASGHSCVDGYCK